MFFIENKILIGNEKNKKGENVEVFLSPKENPWNDSANYLTVVSSEKEKMTLNFFVDTENSIYLSDILVPKGSHKGYGSILLKTLIKNAKELGFLKIHGELFYDDKKHKKRQIKFYKKFGFKILKDNKIELHLHKKRNIIFYFLEKCKLS